jgi:molybdenum cofactor cytidylyltransferase
VKTIAVVPAAGRSRRMGRPKLALPVGDRTVLECVVAALRDGGVDEVVVVLGSGVAAATSLGSRAQGVGAHVLVLDVDTADMRATVEIGLRWAAEQFRPEPSDRWLLAPADHPTVSADVVRSVLRSANHADWLITVPTHGGRRGHPTLIRWSLVEGLKNLPPGRGLNDYFRQFPEQTVEVPVDTPAVLLDLDTPEEYARLCESTGLTPTPDAVRE